MFESSTLDAVDQAEVDDVDPQLGVDDVLERLDDVVVGRDVSPAGEGCAGLGHVCYLR